MDICLKAVIIPIIKSKLSDITLQKNYRPIATTIAQKFVPVKLDQVGPHLATSNNQMGFNNECSTNTAIFCVKTKLKYYKKKTTTMYACFLDLSKTFDRVSQTLLHAKLKKRRIPLNIVQILDTWHWQRENLLKWKDGLSELFYLKSGIRRTYVSNTI